MSSDDEELTLGEIASEPEFSGVNPDTLRKLLNEDPTRGRKRGKTWFVKRGVVRDWLRKQADPSKRGPKLKRKRKQPGD